VKVGPKNKIARADFEVVTPLPPASLPQWSTYQGNADHSGYVPASLNPNEFSEGWVRDVIGSAALNPVAAGDGKVFVTTLGYFGPNVVMALDSATGEELWTNNFGNVHSIQPPAYANGTVYIQSTNHQNDSFIWALNAESGEIIFQTAYENQWDRYYAPTVYEANVYIGGGYYGGAYAFNGISGEELWNADWGNQYMQWTPAVNEAHVITYTGLNDPQLTVINRLTGVVEFSIPDPNFEWDGWSMNLAPVLGSQNNVLAIHDGRLISFDLTNQSIGWQMPQELGDAERFSGQPSLANGIIFAVYDGYLRALNESDGSFLEDWLPWQPPSSETIVTPMIVTDNLIFVSTESATYAVDLESKTEVWSYGAGGHLALSDEGVLFIATADGQLIAIFTD
jgi:outer membrane protein assembly factor BamB